LLHRLRLGERGLQHLDLARPLHLLLGVGKVRLGLRPARAISRDAAALLRANEHQVGFHIARKLVRLMVAAAGRA